MATQPEHTRPPPPSLVCETNVSDNIEDDLELVRPHAPLFMGTAIMGTVVSLRRATVHCFLVLEMCPSTLATAAAQPGTCSQQ